VGAINLEQTFKGLIATFAWYCAFCSHEWPVAEDDRPVDRRKDRQDRRRQSRTNRRRKAD
jgi:hypothetical protein